MTELSTHFLERSRKAHSMVLQAMEESGTGKGVALTWGVSESTVTRAKQDAENVLNLLYALGFKVVEQSKKCVDAKTYDAVMTIFAKATACENTMRKLIWEDTQ